MPVLCDILNTGTELTLGRTLNRHGAWLGEELNRQGMTVRRALTLPDNPIIATELEVSLGQADCVLVTGGLGPTSDDCTRKLTAELLGLGMHEDAATWARISERFAVRGRTCGECQRAQAMVPDGAVVLENANGTAPGLAFMGDNILAGRRARLLVLLPGPPNEMQPIFLQHVQPLLLGIFGGETEKPMLREYHFSGVGEGELAERVMPLIADIGALDVGFCAHADGTVELRLLGSGEAVAQAEKNLATLVATDAYGSAPGTIEQAVVALLSARGKKVAVAESCTGGALASRLTDVSGSSEVFEFGFVTYANAAKSKCVGVSDALLDQQGAVSEQVAAAMAEGALQFAGADFALALTGIAGPGGATATKPVGTVWIGLARRGGETLTRRHVFAVDRAAFKRFAATAALDLLRRNC